MVVLIADKSCIDISFQRIEEDGEDMFNPGKFLEDVLRPWDDRLFVKSKLSATFNVWDSSKKILFHRYW